MINTNNTYAAFMLDYAAGALSQAERLAADLHRALSTEGARYAELLDAAGGAMLEDLEPADVVSPVVLHPGRVHRTADAPGADSAEPSQPGAGSAATHLDRYLDRDLLSLRWRRSLFGVKTLPTELPMASLLRLDPGERAPQHGHGRRDVTVVLCGTFADEFGVYERGDLAFAEPGMKHEPRAVGGRPCVCLVATEPGRPLSGLLGLFGWVRA